MSRITASVTGCAGFIASHVTKQLLEKGYIVHGTVRPEEDHDYLVKLAAVSPGELKIFHADLQQPDSFKDAFAGCTYVFHMAAFVGDWKTDPHAEIVRPHVEGAHAVVAACAAASVKRLVMTSSVGALLNPDFVEAVLAGKPPSCLINEDHWASTDVDCDREQHWLNIYNLSKTLSEKAAWGSASDMNVDLVTICPGMVWGPPVYGHGGGSIRGLVRAITHPSDSKIVCPVVDVRDVAKAHIAAAETQTANGRYALMHTHGFTQKDLNAILCIVCPTLSCKPVDVPAGPLAIDNSKAVDLIGRLIDTTTMIADTLRALIGSKHHGMNELIGHSPHLEVGSRSSEPLLPEEDFPFPQEELIPNN